MNPHPREGDNSGKEIANKKRSCHRRKQGNSRHRPSALSNETRAKVKTQMQGVGQHRAGPSSRTTPTAQTIPYGVIPIDELGRQHPEIQVVEASDLSGAQVSPTFSFADQWLGNQRKESMNGRYGCEPLSEISQTPVTSSIPSSASITNQAISWPLPTSHQHFLLEATQQQYVATRFPPPVDVTTTETTRPHFDAFQNNDQHQLIWSNSMNSSPTIPHAALTLACPEDRGMLNLILLRQQIEYFPATADDIMSHTRGRNKSIAPRQVGIRCRHCSRLAAGQRRKGSTYFPSTLMGIYQAAQNINVEHLQSGVCLEVPHEVKLALIRTRATKTAASGIGKAHWAESARTQGLVDTEDGIRFAVDAARSISLQLPPTLLHG